MKVAARRRTLETRIARKLMAIGARYAAAEQTERAEGLFQAARIVDAELVGTGIEDAPAEGNGAAVTVAPAEPSPDRRRRPPALPVREASPLEAARRMPRAVSPERSEPPTPATRRAPGEGDLSDGDRRLLSALILRARDTPTALLAFLAYYSPRGGAFNHAIAGLRKKGLVTRGERPGLVRLLPAGQRAVGRLEPLPSGPALVDYWCKRLGPCAEALLRTVIDAHPYVLTPHDLLGAAGYAAGGATNKALADLRRCEVLEGFRLSPGFSEAIGIGKGSAPE